MFYGRGVIVLCHGAQKLRGRFPSEFSYIYMKFFPFSVSHFDSNIG